MSGRAIWDDTETSDGLPASKKAAPRRRHTPATPKADPIAAAIASRPRTVNVPVPDGVADWYRSAGSSAQTGQARVIGTRAFVAALAVVAYRRFAEHGLDLSDLQSIAPDELQRVLDAQLVAVYTPASNATE